ncbi:MAG: DUF2306 domain-containing protein [Gammaproteobacteria bacterium]|nr:DUF2306 domain-containing protein [Gammaproteobacteria bacterium]
MAAIIEETAVKHLNSSTDLYQLSCRSLMAVVWFSCAFFGLYILANYAAAYFDNDLLRWNNVLPEIYVPGEPAATVGIGLHFAAGGLILILGGIQLIDGLRNRFPKLHRWTGRVYVLASMVTAIGGLSFIVIRGTVGGTVMNIGFGLYGILTLLAAIQTVRYAMAGQFHIHQAWAWRLFALAIASWLYRMEYGLWFLMADNAWHTDDFRGGFDYFMDFFFYIPNLIIVELMISSRDQQSGVWLRNVATGVMALATLTLLFATWGFARLAWMPAISNWLAT